MVGWTDGSNEEPNRKSQPFVPATIVARSPGGEGNVSICAYVGGQKRKKRKNKPPYPGKTLLLPLLSEEKKTYKLFAPYSLFFLLADSPPTLVMHSDDFDF